jgi:N-methylhydantoinase A
VLEMNMEFDPEVFNLRSDHKRPDKYVLPRALRRTVPEGIDKTGTLQQPLDEAAVRAELEWLLDEGDVECVAVAFMNSYLDERHERAVEEIVADVAGDDVPVSFSVDVLPEIGLYDRATATVVDASLKPVLSDYLGDLNQRLRQEEYAGPLLIMMGNGGVSAYDVVQEEPITSVNSGPAAAAVGTAELARAAGVPDIISMDMGGTSTDVCLIQDATPPVTTENDVGGTPIPTSMVDVSTIGAGGGSVAWLDERGVLQVGPKSAGADPGPICYDQGGERPTVTDANLLLGYINPEYFLGGEAALNFERARDGIEQTLGDPLGLSPEEVAAGVYGLANEQIYNQIRQVSVQRGRDPREFTLVAIGGASPIHAGIVADRLDTDVLVPTNAGTLGAYGLLRSDIRHDFVRSINPQPLAPGLLDTVEEAYEVLKTDARETLREERVQDGDWRFERTLETRYQGQVHQITIPVPDGPIEDVSALADRHHRKHESLFSFRDQESPIEVLSARLTAVAPTPGVPTGRGGRGNAPADAHKGTRDVAFGADAAFQEADIYDGSTPVDGRVYGPAVIEAAYTTVVVPPSFVATSDENGNYHLTTS